MNIGGISIVLILGLANMALIIFQLFSGLRIIKAPTIIHRRTGIALFVTALLHATFAFLAR
ncbi:MAG TPA: hypothetical protein VLM75_14620 [Spirochaetota bacterium]|nr:hypothetical protein [Spirochaetota bacterium]